MVMRRGFGMVEVVVAMTLLGIGVISVTAGAAFSSRMLRLAETEESAARLATAVLDSLSTLHGWTAGTAEQDGLRAVWGAGNAGEDVRVAIVVQAQPDLVLTFATTTPPPIAPLPTSATAE